MNKLFSVINQYKNACKGSNLISLTNLSLNQPCIVISNISRCQSIHSLCNNTLYSINQDNLFYITKNDRLDFITQVIQDYRKYPNFEERSMNKLIRVFGLKPCEAKRLAVLNSFEFVDNIEETLEKASFLISEGFSIDAIKKNILILRDDKDSFIFRIRLMSNWDIDKSIFSDFLPLFRLSQQKFVQVSNRFEAEKKLIPHGNRMIYLSKLMECSLMDLNKQTLDCLRIIHMDFNSLKSSLNCYQKFGVQNEEILSNLKCLCCSQSVIERRLSIVRGKEITPIVPSFVTCEEKEFLSTLDLLEKEKKVFSPFKNRDEYLSTKLDIHPQVLRQIKYLYKFLHKMPAKDVVAKLNFLFDCGFTPATITVDLANLQIFKMDFSTLKERYAEMNKVGIEHPTFKSLMKPQDKYEEFVMKKKSECIKNSERLNR